MLSAYVFIPYEILKLRYVYQPHQESIARTINPAAVPHRKIPGNNTELQSNIHCLVLEPL